MFMCNAEMTVLHSCFFNNLSQGVMFITQPWSNSVRVCPIFKI